MVLRLRPLAIGLTLVPLLLLSLPAQAARRGRVKQAPLSWSAAAANDAASRPLLYSASQKGTAVLRAQILLDRAHFSVGEIDGQFGSNTRSAATAFNSSRKIRRSA